MRQRFLPLTAGDWHSVPLRVFAKQRGANRSRSVGSVTSFDCFSTAPSLIDHTDDRLAAFVHVDVFDPDRLLTTSSQLSQRLDLSRHGAAELRCQRSELRHGS